MSRAIADEMMGGRRPEILYVMASYPPRVGGAERQAHGVARLLVDHFAPHVLTGRVPGCADRECVDGVNVRRVSMSDDAGLGPALFSAISLVASGMRDNDPAVVQGFQFNGVTFAAAVIALQRRAPLVIKLTHRDNLERSGGTRHRAQTAFILRIAAAVTAPSETLLDLARSSGIPSHKLHYIPNGVDTDHFRPLVPESRSHLRKSFGYNERDFVFAWVGRLDPFKQLGHVLAAWGPVQEARPEARLILIGDGEDETIAQELVRQFPHSVRRFHFQRDVRPYYQCADALLLTTRGEGLSNTLLEATASGLPAVVSGIPENTEVAGNEGFLAPFNPASAADLERALVQTIDERDSAPSRAAAARERAKKVYSLDATAAKWRDLYLSLITRDASIAKDRTAHSVS